ncbi:trehalose phosphatase [Burkholderia stagnalis]|uniref:HAD family hydrolase n=1 Tax=Burkholderia stagnalis TaxID=1503054 RepID=UPI000F58E1C6|nr:trehalose phosphatase [Burkholderia stagnalis]RQQ03525.1 trehalose phosphatase [Burkholderia stagnalis]RQQ11915.1 trehalose phosphatase [Burkholderia stagnalis]RQQ27267.1 trehalose phosphatase [Burkholderia stagnalis]RQQ30284.1 trehalose phosphatase [Burkholderia stagnalis]RQQ30397.1 trehalose phosphatase [Burkholderia stagnalis]
MGSKRPLVLVDLDDTLFQTARKMPDGTPRIPATVDVHGEPNGYMTPVQQAFIGWLLASADVVPVTARSVEAYRRVKLPFTHGAVCSHGGVILHADGTLDQGWHGRMAETLEAFQDRLPALCDATLQIGAALGFSLRGWVAAEHGLRHYVVTKHNESDDAALAAVLAEVRARGLLEGMHIHANGNNLAFLPDGLAKRVAAQEWLRRDRELNGERPVLGLGDSITDLGFMDLCHMWATPARSQLAKAAEGLIHA